MIQATDRRAIVGSLVNRMAEQAKMPEPAVGIGATILYYTDRVAVTIIAVSANRRVVETQDDKAIRTDANGMSDSQSYRFERNPGGRVRIFTRRKNGRYVEEGSRSKNGLQLAIGTRSQYHDYSF